MNKVILIGYIHKSTQIRHFEGDLKVAKFVLTTSEPYLNKDIPGMQTEFHHIALWGQMATLAEESLKLGALICLEGKLRTRSWTSKYYPEMRQTRTEIVVDSFKILAEKPCENPHQETPADTYAAAASQDISQLASEKTPIETIFSAQIRPHKTPQKSKF